MKYRILLLLLLTNVCSYSQASQELLDSLIRANKNYIKESSWEKALQTNIALREAAVKLKAMNSKEMAISDYFLAEILFNASKFDSAYLIIINLVQNSGQISTLSEYYNINSQFLLARIFDAKGQIDSAKYYFLNVLNSQKSFYGDRSIECARTLIELGKIDSRNMAPGLTETYLLEAQGILDQLPHEVKLMSICMQALGTLYWKRSEFDKAEFYFLKSAKLYIDLFGKTTINYAQILSSLALVNKSLGKYELAEHYNLEAISIYEKANRMNLPDYPVTIYNLGRLYSELGINEKAKNNYYKSLEVFEKIYGKKHGNYAENLNALSNLFRIMSNYDDAERYIKQAQEIYLEVYGVEHIQYITSINDLGNIQKYKKNYVEAEVLLLDCIGKIIKKQGTLNRYYGIACSNLGDVYKLVGDYANADKYYEETRHCWEKIFGKNHMFYSLILDNIANLRVREGKFNLAQDHYLELFKIIKFQLDGAFRFMSDSEREQFVKVQCEDKLNRIQAFIAQYPSAEMSNLQYDISLLTKGMRLEASKQTIEYALKSNDSLAYLSYKEWLQLQRKLSNIYKLPINARAEMSLVEARIDTLEKQLTKASSGWHKSDSTMAVNYESIRNGLKAGELAVEFVKYAKSNHSSKDSIYYAAVVLNKSSVNATYIPLCSEVDVHKGLNLPYKQPTKNLSEFFVSRGVMPLSQNLNVSNIYSLIWAPILNKFKSVEEIKFSPTGILNKLNLSAVNAEDRFIMCDLFKMSCLSSTRSIVHKRKYSKNHTNNAIIVGGIQYDLPATDSTLQKIIPEDTSESIFEFANIDNSENWKFLPGTVSESEAIYNLFDKKNLQAKLISGKDATEEEIKLISELNPFILHIATHGFFYERNESLENGFSKSDLSERDSLRHSNPDTSKSQLVGTMFKLNQHPMLRSGLLLAGANAAWNGAAIPEGMEDGILTAYEISQMNLSNTELVVLSACETGLGDIQGNEGVYGLQRAFKIAGAKYIIMSLWQVPDKQTSMLMITFYKKWLEHKMTIPDAFRAAQKELRDSGLDPYQWAGFVLLE